MSNAFRQRKGAQEMDNDCGDNDDDDDDDDDVDDDADHVDDINGVGEKENTDNLIASYSFRASLKTEIWWIETEAD